MEKEIVHVGLYGGKGIFGGRETPLEASIIKCGMAEKCGFHKQGQCAAIRSIGTKGCKYGTEEVKKGYTSRAMKYGEFKSRWVGHEKYRALTKNKKGLAVIGDEVYFSYSYINLEKDEKGNVEIGNVHKIRGENFIPLSQFDEDFIYKICMYRPQALMGGTINDYREKEIPKFLGHLKEMLPDLYESFISKYKEFDDAINYEGRKAYLSSLEPCYVEYKGSTTKSFNSKWYWDGTSLEYIDGHVPDMWIVGKYEDITIRIVPKEGEVIEITDNEQVTEGTIFVD